jgi:hypothetical protein
MASWVSLVGVSVAAIGLLGAAAPDRLVALLAAQRVLTSLSATVALRIGFGALFVVAAPDCRLPGLVRFVGALEFVGAAVLLLLGAGRLRHFVEWWLGQPSSFVRRWCLGALIFGVAIAVAGAGGG